MKSINKTINLMYRNILAALIILIEYLLHYHFIVVILNYIPFRIKCRSTPPSFSFIMDGNRRYCRLKKTKLSKSYGVEKLFEIVTIAYEMGVEQITFFTLSVKNLGRKDEDVDFERFLNKYTHSIKDYMRIEIMGQVELLGENVCEKLHEIVDSTKNNVGINVTLCIAYSAATEDKRTVDILVRTGDTTRLSEFMLYGVSKGAHINFIRAYWPQINRMYVYLIYFKYLLEKKLIAMGLNKQ